MSEVRLRPCQLCGDTPRIVGESDFHQSFAIYTDDGTVEHNFLHYGAIQCSCGLTLPFYGGEENRKDNIAFWNGEL